jgi:hypothetical protein
MTLIEILSAFGNLSPYALLLIAVVAYQQGWIVSAATVDKIVASTVKQVLAACERDNETVVAQISARIIASIDAMLTEHEVRILREFDRTNSTPPRRYL